ncbi:MAG: hypothetical protein ACLUFU_02845 [Bacilli bacterium]
MQVYLQIPFRENLKEYNHLKENSYYFKELNRGVIDYKRFVEDMKIKYKERVTDKINNVVDNMDLISSVLDVLK